jgi:hypothetical protein
MFLIYIPCSDLFHGTQKGSGRHEGSEDVGTEDSAEEEEEEKEEEEESEGSASGSSSSPLSAHASAADPYTYGFASDINLPFRTLEDGTRELAFPPEVLETAADADPIVAVFVDGTKKELTCWTVGQHRQSLQRRKADGCGALFVGEHHASHNKITVTQRCDRALLLSMYEQTKQISSVRVDIFGDLPSPQPGVVPDNNATLLKAAEWLVPMARDYCSGKVVDKDHLRKIRDDSLHELLQRKKQEKKELAGAEKTLLQRLGPRKRPAAAGPTAPAAAAAAPATDPAAAAAAPATDPAAAVAATAASAATTGSAAAAAAAQDSAAAAPATTGSAAAAAATTESTAERCKGEVGVKKETQEARSERISEEGVRSARAKGEGRRVEEKEVRAKKKAKNGQEAPEPKKYLSDIPESMFDFEG